MCYASVNGTVCANFHIIFYNYSTATRHFFIPYSSFFFCVVVKSIATNYCTCLYYNVVTNGTMIHNCNVWMNNTVTTNAYIVANKSCWKNVCAFTNTGRINCSCCFCKWPIMCNYFTISFERIITDQQSFSRRDIYFFVYDDKGCTAVYAFIVIFWMIYKSKITHFYPV